MNAEDLRRLLAPRGFEGAAVEPLAGDASTRRYHRVVAVDGRTAVLLEQGDALPPAVHGAEEPFAFLRWQAFYAGLGLRVPAVLGVDRASGLVLLEDLGDELLQRRVEQTSPSACLGLYLEAADLATRLAGAGTPRFVPDEALTEDPLVPRRLAWEMDFLLAHGLGRPQESLASAGGALQEARVLLHQLCADVHGGDAARGPEGLPLCHRDYHARNLLVVRGADGSPTLAVIDFQDTRRGPRAYDTASLAFDPYVRLPPDLREAIVARTRPGSVTEDAWRAEVHLAAAQRLFKAAGSYAYLTRERGRAEYLQWFGPALREARACLGLWPHRSDLLRALGALGLDQDALPPRSR